MLVEVAQEINSLAGSYSVGSLQKFRKDNNSFSRLPSKQLFDLRTVFEDEGYGYHYGGRKELQFNIGIEGDYLRYGIAFSLECSQSLPSIDILVPKISLFNEYISEHVESYFDLRMWHYQDGKRSNDHMPCQISPELVREGTFIFLGCKQIATDVDYAEMMRTFDRLYPLYLFTERTENLIKDTEFKFSFKSGCSFKRSETSANYKNKILNVELKHNEMQYQLHKELALEFGAQNVGTEILVEGGSIDLVVKRGDNFWFYEIKTAQTAKTCIRQAMGQILEYSFWSKSYKPEKMVIVGPARLNMHEKEYLDTLNTWFQIPLEYRVVHT